MTHFQKIGNRCIGPCVASSSQALPSPPGHPLPHAPAAHATLCVGGRTGCCIGGATHMTRRRASLSRVRNASQEHHSQLHQTVRGSPPASVLVPPTPMTPLPLPPPTTTVPTTTTTTTTSGWFTLAQRLWTESCGDCGEAMALQSRKHAQLRPRRQSRRYLE